MKQLILGLLVLVSTSAFAGPRIVGNGGIGVQQGRNIYMLDLFERGIHQSAYYAPGVRVLEKMSEEITQAMELSNLQRVPLEKLVYKISEVYAKQFATGFHLHQAILGLEWRLIDADLVATEDAKTPLDGLNLKQVAVRQGNVVYISLAAWDQLDEDNKVALIIHEAFYYAVTPEKIEKGDKIYFFQSAVKVRSVTGLIFSKRFAVEGFTNTNNLYVGARYSEARFSVENYFRLSRYKFLEDISFFPGFSSGYYPTDIDKSWSRSDLQSGLTQEIVAACKDSTLTMQRGRIQGFIEIRFLAWELDTGVFAYQQLSGENQLALRLTGNFEHKSSLNIDLPQKNFAKNCQQVLRNKVMAEFDKMYTPVQD